METFIVICLMELLYTFSAEPKKTGILYNCFLISRFALLTVIAFTVYRFSANLVFDTNVFACSYLGILLIIFATFNKARDVQLIGFLLLWFGCVNITNVLYRNSIEFVIKYDVISKDLLGIFNSVFFGVTIAVLFVSGMLEDKIKSKIALSVLGITLIILVFATILSGYKLFIGEMI